jgi:quercetin dioxygenase-like cupin family protein
MPAKHTYLRTHRLSGEVMAFALPREEVAIRERAAAAKAGRAAKTLVKEGALRLTLVALRKGVVLQPHQVDGPVSIQVLRGKAKVDAPGEGTALAAGGIVTVPPRQTHAATALTDCTLLITVAEP